MSENPENKFEMSTEDFNTLKFYLKTFAVYHKIDDLGASREIEVSVDGKVNVLKLKFPQILSVLRASDGNDEVLARFQEHFFPSPRTSNKSSDEELADYTDGIKTDKQRVLKLLEEARNMPNDEQDTDEA